MSKTISFVLIGDTKVGRSQLALNYHGKPFGSYPSDDSHEREMNIFGNPWIVRIFDSSGGPDYEKLRCLSYSICQGIILCAAVDNPQSLENLRTKWLPEFRKYKCANLPMILAITKSDLKDEVEDQNNFIQPSHINEVARQLSVADVYECSAKTGQNVIELCKRAAELGIRAQQTKKRRCCIS